MSKNTSEPELIVKLRKKKMNSGHGVKLNRGRHQGPIKKRNQ